MNISNLLIFGYVFLGILKIIKIIVQLLIQTLYVLIITLIQKNFEKYQDSCSGWNGSKVLLTNKENLKKEVKRYLGIFKDHPYIFNLGHGVLPETDPQMMDYLVKMVKDY